MQSQLPIFDLQCVWVCRQLEDALDHKNAELIDLRKAALEHAVASPIKPSSHLQSALGAWGNAVEPLARQPEGAGSSGAEHLDQEGFHQTPSSAQTSHGYTSGIVCALPAGICIEQP